MIQILFAISVVLVLVMLSLKLYSYFEIRNAKERYKSSQLAGIAIPIEEQCDYLLGINHERLLSQTGVVWLTSEQLKRLVTVEKNDLIERIHKVGLQNYCDLVKNFDGWWLVMNEEKQVGIQFQERGRIIQLKWYSQVDDCLADFVGIKIRESIG